MELTCHLLPSLHLLHHPSPERQQMQSMVVTSQPRSLSVDHIYQKHAAVHVLIHPFLQQVEISIIAISYNKHQKPEETGSEPSVLGY